MIVERQSVDLGELRLDSGETISNATIAYESYGKLNEARSNAVLIQHAFSGDAHAAGVSKKDGATGWWESMIGPGKAFDTDKYFVFCSNVLGGCSGTTGPGSTNPATGKPYGLGFPFVTVADMVRLQKGLVDYLGIEKLLSVSGGSMGGMQALQWAASYPQMCASIIPIASTHRHSAQQIAFNEVGRQAIMADPDFEEGNYYDGPGPGRGLSVARMIGHITYMSDDSMREKFGRRRREMGDEPSLFEVESYLRYRGGQFVGRFDANSYIAITKAMDTFDLSLGYASLGDVFEPFAGRFLVISFTSDWLYPSYQSQEIVRALRGRVKDVAYVELPSSYGHDAFLVEAGEQTEVVSGFLASTFKKLTPAGAAR
jgi:homoserine O-acetyltransferase